MPPMGPRSRLWRSVTAAALLALGLVAGLAAVLVHGRTWGLVLGLAAPATTLWALPRGWWSRGAFALGWAGIVTAATGTRPEGDYLIAAAPRGYALLAGVPVLLIAALATLAPERGSRDESEPGRRMPRMSE